MVYETFEEQLVGFEPENRTNLPGSSGDTHLHVHNTHTLITFWTHEELHNHPDS